MKQIACFLTCGYTESGAMQAFLRSINPNFEYKQWLPNKSRKRKGTAKSISHSLCGLTGESLLEKVCWTIAQHQSEITKCSAIIYEDDLDGRFHSLSDDQIKYEISIIKQRIVAAVGQNIPVFVIFASPEIEGWFLADWDNGFGYLYGKSETMKGLGTANIRQWFTINLRRYIQDELLQQYQDCIEDYGYFDGKYVKLSDEIIRTLQEPIDSWLNVQNNERILAQFNGNQLRYSKRLHGDEMLRNIDAVLVAERCQKYFRPVYHELQSFL